MMRIAKTSTGEVSSLHTLDLAKCPTVPKRAPGLAKARRHAPTRYRSSLRARRQQLPEACRERPKPTGAAPAHAGAGGRAPVNLAHQRAHRTNRGSSRHARAGGRAAVTLAHQRAHRTNRGSARHAKAGGRAAVTLAHQRAHRTNRGSSRHAGAGGRVAGHARCDEAPTPAQPLQPAPWPTACPGR